MTAEALSASKYAAYIWPAYAVSALGFAWMIVDTLARANRWKGRADRLEDDGARASEPAAPAGAEAEPGAGSNVPVQGAL
jgi:heme exporter protein D